MGDRNEPAIDIQLISQEPAIDIQLRISRSVLWTGVAAGCLYALYNSSDSTKENIMNILRSICEGVVNGRIDPQILNLFRGSLRVTLRCYSRQSFLQFLDDYETGRAKERLNEEFSKIGIGNVILEIANAEEIEEKKKNLGNFPAMNKTQKSLSINQIHPLIRGKICKKLDVRHTLGGDFRTLAAMVGMLNEDIELTSQRNEPTEEVLKWWGKKKEATVPKLRQILEEMERDDVIQILDDNPTEAVLQLSTDQVDASSKDAPKATATNNSVEGDTTGVAKTSTDEVDASGATAKSGLPSPPPIKLIKLRDMNPKDIEWRTATKDPIDVLLIVVNDKEFRAAYGILGKPMTSDSGQNLGTVYFGEIGNNKVALLRSSQGAGGKIGMQATCLGAIKALRPKSIICLGVCFGMDKSKHKLGDVLVSTKLGTYGPCRISNDGSEVSRGVITGCNARLSRLFNNGEIGWKSPRNDVLQPTVHCGLVVSGPQLIDNNGRKKALKDRYPEAIGGEMEGEGLYNICEHFEVPWIVCKAVSDYADGTKEKTWQPFAAAVSASLVQHVLTKNYIPKRQHGQLLAEESAVTSAQDEEDAGPPKRPKKLRIGEINGLLHEKLCTKLNIKNKGKDYIALAGVMGYTRDEIASFQLGTDPADALLTNWGVECGNDVSRLYEHLRKIGRKDLVDMLEESSS